MSKNIVVLNQKGGVGNSTIADEIAFGFERAGFSINFYDLDSQGGILHSGAKNNNAEYNIIDTSGMLQKDMVSWIKEADIIIIPTKPTTRDIPVLETMIQIIEDNNISVPVLYVFNMSNSYRTSRDFEEWFANKYPNCRTIAIPQSETFIQAAAEGKSVVECKKNSVPADKIKALISIVMYELGIKQ